MTDFISCSLDFLDKMKSSQNLQEHMETLRKGLAYRIFKVWLASIFKARSDNTIDVAEIGKYFSDDCFEVCLLISLVLEEGPYNRSYKLVQQGIPLLSYDSPLDIPKEILVEYPDAVIHVFLEKL